MTLVSVVRQIERDRAWLEKSPVVAEMRRIERRKQAHIMRFGRLNEPWERIAESVERMEKMNQER